MIKGSITIETTISTVVLMTCVLFVSLFLRVTYIHGAIQHALVQTSNELSTYSYIISSLGINELNDTLNEKTGESVKNASQVIDNVSELWETVTGSDFTDVEDIKQTSEKISHAGDTVLSLDGEDFKKYLEDFACAAAMEVYDEGKTYIFNLIAKPLFFSYLGQEDIFKFIEGGKEGIDFSQSRYFEINEENSIHLVAVYKIKAQTPLKIVEYIPMIQGVKSRVWKNYSEEEMSDSIYDTGKSIWDLSPLERYKAIALENFKDFNLPYNFKALRGYEKSTGEAKTYVTINLNDGSYRQNSSQIESRLKNKLVSVAEFEEEVYKDISINAKDIKKVTYYVYIPANSSDIDKEAVYNFAQDNKALKLSDNRVVDVEVKIEERE